MIVTAYFVGKCYSPTPWILIVDRSVSGHSTFETIEFQGFLQVSSISDNTLP